jgi:hypothetical protein
MEGVSNETRELIIAMRAKKDLEIQGRIIKESLTT